MKDFCNLVVSALGGVLGETYEVSWNEVEKNNGIVRYGVTIKEKGSNIAPVIYMETYYEKYKFSPDRTTLLHIVNEILDTYEEANLRKIEMDLSFIEDFSKVKPMLTLRLVNKDRNEEKLKSVPHIVFLDMVILFYIDLTGSESEEKQSIMVTNKLMSCWTGVSTEILYRAALGNYSKMEIKVVNIGEQCRNLISVKTDGIPGVSFQFPDVPGLYVISNKDNTFGASSILCPNLLEEIEKNIGQSFYILPSSVHEVLMLYAEENTDVEDLRQMVKSVNETEVSQDEFLSNNVYLFRNGELVIA